VSVHYHGCIPLKWVARKRWVSAIDLNEYAEANDIVVLYPQAAGDPQSGTGCWNWFNYNFDRHFDDRRGVALRTVRAIVEDLPNAVAGALVSDGDAIPDEVLADSA